MRAYIRKNAVCVYTRVLRMGRRRKISHTDVSFRYPLISVFPYGAVRDYQSLSFHIDFYLLSSTVSFILFLFFSFFSHRFKNLYGKSKRTVKRACHEATIEKCRSIQVRAYSTIFLISCLDRKNQISSSFLERFIA